MPNIDDLIPDIQKLFDTGRTLSDISLERFTKEISTNIAERFTEYSQERIPRLRMSNVGKPLRQLWYEISSGLTPEPLPASAKFKFLYGDILEDVLLLLAIEAGHTVTDIGREVNVDGVSGKIDCVIDGWLVDFKSCSSYSFTKFKNNTIRTDDPFGYIGQLAGYSFAIGNLDSALLAVDKVTGNLCLCKFTKEELSDYKVESRIPEVREILKSKEPPKAYCYEAVPDGKSGNLKLPVGCSYCSHKFNCRPEIRTFIYSTGPVYLTHVERLPYVQEIKREERVNSTQEYVS